MVNGRITAEQMEWLETRADELGGNLSAALRQTISDARFLELARADYHKDDGTTRVVELVLAMTISDPTDLELREEEAKE
jgi:hypothetical protein